MSTLWAAPGLSCSPSVRVLRVGFAVSGWTVEQFWVASFGVGGNRRPDELAATLRGLREVSAAEHDLLVLVLTERLADLGIGRMLRWSHELDLVEHRSP